MNLGWGIDQAIAKLPENDLIFARAVYSAFAFSSLPRDRRVGAARIRYLTKVDHDYGLSLWDQLIRDVEPDVRRAAVTMPQFYRSAVRRRNTRHIAQAADETGLTSSEAAGLVRKYEAAERGERLCDLGDLALMKLTDGHPLRHVTIYR